MKEASAALRSYRQPVLLLAVRAVSSEEALHVFSTVGWLETLVAAFATGGYVSGWSSRSRFWKFPQSDATELYSRLDPMNAARLLRLGVLSDLQTQRKKSNKQLFSSFLKFVVARQGNQRSAGLSSHSAILADGLVWNYESVDKGRFTPDWALRQAQLGKCCSLWLRSSIIIRGAAGRVPRVHSTCPFVMCQFSTRWVTRSICRLAFFEVCQVFLGHSFGTDPLKIQEHQKEKPKQQRHHGYERRGQRSLAQTINMTRPLLAAGFSASAKQDTWHLLAVFVCLQNDYKSFLVKFLGSVEKEEAIRFWWCSGLRS